ncbi:Hypothetical_protein [Hexamita inflata]|uniref:Hypothetical_protein n=1 Tax=Hexamita inflata TaxID=28002 RepID=A0AA86V176_9EUKA|nr:Hypothetical protein HINF_LOCUS60061 [Hexamita inflata]
MAVPVNTSYLFTIIQIYFYTLYQCVRNHRQFLINTHSLSIKPKLLSINVNSKFYGKRELNPQPTLQQMNTLPTRPFWVIGYFTIFMIIYFLKNIQYKNKQNQYYTKTKRVIYNQPIWSGKIISVVQIRFWSGKGRFKFWSGVVQKQCEKLVEWKYP